MLGFNPTRIQRPSHGAQQRKRQITDSSHVAPPSNSRSSPDAMSGSNPSQRRGPSLGHGGTSGPRRSKPTGGLQPPTKPCASVRRRVQPRARPGEVGSEKLRLDVAKPHSG